MHRASRTSATFCTVLSSRAAVYLSAVRVCVCVGVCGRERAISCSLSLCLSCICDWLPDCRCVCACVFWSEMSVSFLFYYLRDEKEGFTL